MRGAIVLAGGPSQRLGAPKPFARVGGAMLIEHVLAAARNAAEEVVVVSRGDLAGAIEAALPGIRVVRDRARGQSPLAGLIAGARALPSEHVAALASDLPFLRPPLLHRLFLEAEGVDAAIPRWPNGQIEPLVAVYRRRALLAAARTAWAAGGRSNQAMIARLRRVRYVPTASLRAEDSRLLSFLNVNTPADLARARRLARITSRSAARPRRR